MYAGLCWMWCSVDGAALSVAAAGAWLSYAPLATVAELCEVCAVLALPLAVLTRPFCRLPPLLYCFMCHIGPLWMSHEQGTLRALCGGWGDWPICASKADRRSENAMWLRYGERVLSMGALVVEPLAARRQVLGATLNMNSRIWRGSHQVRGTGTQRLTHVRLLTATLCSFVVESLFSLRHLLQLTTVGLGDITPITPLVCCIYHVMWGMVAVVGILIRLRLIGKILVWDVVVATRPVGDPVGCGGGNFPAFSRCSPWRQPEWCLTMDVHRSTQRLTLSVLDYLSVCLFGLFSVCLLPLTTGPRHRLWLRPQRRVPGPPATGLPCTGDHERDEPPQPHGTPPSRPPQQSARATRGLRDGGLGRGRLSGGSAAPSGRLGRRPTGGGATASGHRGSGSRCGASRGGGGGGNGGRARVAGMERRLYGRAVQLVWASRAPAGRALLPPVRYGSAVTATSVRQTGGRWGGWDAVVKRPTVG